MKKIKKHKEYIRGFAKIIEANIYLIENEYTKEEIENNIEEILAHYFLETDCAKSVLNRFPELKDDIDKIQDFLHLTATEYFNEKYFS